MIHDTLDNIERYAGLHPLFPRAIEFIRSNNLLTLETGRHHVAGEDLIAIVEHVSAKVREAAKLECHRRYIDIQLVLDGNEEMGWRALKDCRQPIAEFNTEKDIQFFSDKIEAWAKTQPNEFCIFFPQDAHAPLVGNGKIRKIIFKIAVKPAS